MTYGGGDFCEEEWMERKVRFDFHCDPSIDFEVRYVDKASKPCEYIFAINSNQACNLIAPNGSLIKGGRGFLHKVFSFYYEIFLLILSILYYLLVIFVIFCIYKAITYSFESQDNPYAKSINLKERASYIYYKIKLAILG